MYILLLEKIIQKNHLTLQRQLCQELELGVFQYLFKLESMASLAMKLDVVEH